MTHEEKIELPELLDTMVSTSSEAGFPIASDGDFYAVHEIASGEELRICGLSRAAFTRSTAAPRRSSRRSASASTRSVHLAGAHEMEAAEGAASGTHMVMRAGDRAQPCDDRGMEPEDGNPTEFDSSAAASSRHQGGAPRSIFRHRRLHVPRIFRRCSAKVIETCRIRQGALLGACPQRSRMAVANSLAGVKAVRTADRMHHQRHR